MLLALFLRFWFCCVFCTIPSKLGENVFHFKKWKTLKWKSFSPNLEFFFHFMENIFTKEFIFREMNYRKSEKRFPENYFP